MTGDKAWRQAQDDMVANSPEGKAYAERMAKHRENRRDS